MITLLLFSNSTFVYAVRAHEKQLGMQVFVELITEILLFSIHTKS